MSRCCLALGVLVGAAFLLSASATADVDVLETSAFPRWQINPYWDVGAGYRFSDGKISSPELENTWSASSFILQFGRSFYPRRN